MARDVRQPKSESLTIRLDPKTRFILEYMSRVRGQTITTVVERAIIESASNVKLEDGYRDWKDLWDISDGVRYLKVARQQELYPTFEEEQLLSFAEEHHVFFYVDRKKGIFKNYLIEILWPRIKEFLDYWTEHRSSDFFGAGRKMAEVIRAAGVEPPTWPPGAKNGSDKQSSGDRMSDIIDDDIPF